MKQKHTLHRKSIDEGIELSLNVYKHLVNINTTGIILTDQYGQIQLVNSAAEEQFGYKEIEILDRNIQLLIPPVKGFLFKEPCSKDQSTINLNDRLGLEVNKKNGKSFPVEISSSSFIVGGHTFITHFISDLTQKKKIEQQLIQSEQNYRVLFEHSPIMIWEEDFSKAKSYFDHLKRLGVNDFRIYFTDHPKEVKKLASMVSVTNVNRASLKFYGVNRKKEIMDKKLPDWFNQDSWTIFMEELIQLAQGHSEFNAEIVVKLPSGDNRNLLMYITVPHPYLNNLSKVIVSFVDITRLKQTEMALVKEKQTAQRYLQIANAIILVLDVYGRILMINQKGCEVLGYDQQELVGKNWFDHFIPEELRSEIASVHEQVTSGDATNLEFYENEILVRGGERRTIEWHNAVIHDQEGKINGVISSGVDITLRKKAEAATIKAIHKGQEQERERIAQELHDGLSQQLAASNMLLSSLEPDLENLGSESKEIFNNARDILLQTIADARNISHDLTPIALKETGLFSAIENLCNHTQTASSLKIVLAKSGDDRHISEPVAIGMYRIAQELLNNIIKHAGATETKIDIKQQKSLVTMVVQDNGKGIESTTDELPSSGIGLRNISSRLRGLHGKMTINTSRKAGTLIKVVVPAS